MSLESPEQISCPGPTLQMCPRHICLTLRLVISPLLVPYSDVSNGKGGDGMPYEEARPVGHHLILEDRESLTVSGVEEVESFDENTIVMYTAQGTLIVRGEGLHIEKLSLDGGDLKVEGMVESLTYEETRRNKGGFFARLLG